MKSRVRNNYNDKEKAIISLANNAQAKLTCHNFGYAYYGIVGTKPYKICDYQLGVTWFRVTNCKAYIAEYGDLGRYILIRSYNTIIGVYDKLDATYYSMGAYSMTTYQHERKAINTIKYEYRYQVRDCVNLYTVDNFAE